MSRWFLCAAVTAALTAAPSIVTAQQPAPPARIELDTGDAGPPPQAKPPTTRAEARPWHVRALHGTARMELDAALDLIEHEHFAAEYVAHTSRDERRALVQQIRAAFAGANEIRVREESDGVHIRLDGATSLEAVFTIDDRAPFAITALRVAPLAESAKQPVGPALSWDDLRARLDAAEADGFSGQVLARREGREVLRATYGMADRKAERRTAPDDIYCIGSTPIDFTVTAARLLAKHGKLDLDAEIGRYLPNVPADRATLTPRMILEGRSGLPNFHDVEGDWDTDLQWIDRATAVRRIFALPMLFAPGAQQQHSHSAYGLLAAIVEVASGQTYPDFVRSEILRPLGMTRTGFYGETLGLPADAFATGYGTRSAGAPNIPPNWGPTSWLVMGSGGMFSTLDDLRRYFDAMADGALFADHEPLLGAGVSVNGSDRGFFFTRIDDGKGDQVFLISNTDGAPALKALMDGLVPMVMGPR